MYYNRVLKPVYKRANYQRMFRIIFTQIYVGAQCTDIHVRKKYNICIKILQDFVVVPHKYLISNH